MQDAAKACEVEAPKNQAVSDIIGLSLERAIEIIFPQITHQQRQAIEQAYKEVYVSSTVPSEPYEGVLERLQELQNKGYRMAVATGKSRKGLQRHLDEMNLNPLFDSSRCADETQSKPDPTMLLEICEELNIEPQHALMIGDTSYDMEMAQRIDMPRAAVLCGVHDRKTLQAFEPCQIANTVVELDL